MKKKKSRNSPFTVAESKVMTLLQQGMSNQQIAETIGRSPHTVKKHIENMLAKTGASNRLELCAKVGFMSSNKEQ